MQSKLIYLFIRKFTSIIIIIIKQLITRHNVNSVQNEIIKTKEESQERTSHAIRQEMIVYRGMILNYV